MSGIQIRSLDEKYAIPIAARLQQLDAEDVLPVGRLASSALIRHQLADLDLASNTALDQFLCLMAARFDRLVLLNQLLRLSPEALHNNQLLFDRCLRAARDAESLSVLKKLLEVSETVFGVTEKRKRDHLYDLSADAVSEAQLQVVQYLFEEPILLNDSRMREATTEIPAWFRHRLELSLEAWNRRVFTMLLDYAEKIGCDLSMQPITEWSATQRNERFIQQLEWLPSLQSMDLRWLANELFGLETSTTTDDDLQKQIVASPIVVNTRLRSALARFPATELSSALRREILCSEACRQFVDAGFPPTLKDFRQLLQKSAKHAPTHPRI